MGHKSRRTRQHLLYFVTTVILIIATQPISSCVPVQDRLAELTAQFQLKQNRHNIAAGFFETVLQECNQILEQNTTKPPADVAYYSLGHVYANNAYPGRDYAVSKMYFSKLIKNFPDSPLSSEAKTFVTLFDLLEKKDSIIDAAAKLPAAPPKTEPDPLHVAHEIPSPKYFEETIKKDEQLLEQNESPNFPKDALLYNLGLIYAHMNNPAKDYKKSLHYFEELVKNYPDSPLAGEAAIWVGVFDTIDKIQQIDIEIEQQKKQLNR